MDRMVVKARKMLRFAGCCQMPGCTRHATDLHEIVNRGRSQNSSAARELSYAEELTVLLCEKCHSQAHNPASRDVLFKVNFELYSYERVKEAFDRVIEAMGGSLDISLPVP